MSEHDPLPNSLAQRSRQIRQGILTPIDVVRTCLAQMRKHESNLHAMTFVATNEAISEAKQATRDIAEGNWLGPLHGVPVVVKDIFDVMGMPTTSNSSTIKPALAKTDAEVVSRLRAAGAIILGKAATWELAIGENDIEGRFPRCRNPHDTTRESGGSSSGSAVAVAVGECLAALGSDTGGSTRCPAAWCGVVGFKPSLGVLSTLGMVPLAKSLDSPGILTRSVEDTQIVFDILHRKPPAQPANSSTSSEILKIATWPRRNWSGWNLSDDVRTMFQRTLRVLKDAGILIEEISLPAIEVYNRISVLISRREGFESHEAQYIDDAWRMKLEPSTRARLSEGEAISKKERNNAYRERASLIHETSELTAGFDAVITPTMHVTAPKLSTNAEVMQVGQPLLVRYASCLGVPSISIPCGSAQNGLPYAICLNGHRHADHRFLDVAVTVERALSRHFNAESVA